MFQCQFNIFDMEVVCSVHINLLFLFFFGDESLDNKVKERKEKKKRFGFKIIQK